MNKRIRSVIVFILILSLVVPMMITEKVSLAADLPPENMGTIPINTPFVINTARAHSSMSKLLYYGEITVFVGHSLT